MERLPILQDDDDLLVLKDKLDEETRELDVEIVKYIALGRIPNRDNAAREALDVLQLAIGILAVLEKQGADVPVLIWEHTEKLIRRGWKVKRYITIDWRGNHVKKEPE